MLKKFICLQLVRSLVGKNKKIKFIIKSLGFNKINSIIKVKNISSIRGKIKKILNFINILYLC